MLLYDFFRGTIRVEIKCENVGEMINELRYAVCPRRLRKAGENIVSFVCYDGQMKSVEECAKRKAAEILSVKNKGFPVILRRLCKRPGLLLGCLIVTFSIFASTFFVWQIRVEGNEGVSEGKICEMLGRAGLCEGMAKKRINVKSIVNRVLINEDELSWISVNLDGTVAHIEVKESKVGVLQDKRENVNIVASHSGIIMRVDALDGQCMVEKGAAVEKGSLLVSAFVDKRTGGSILRGARGYVWAQTEREYMVYVPLEYFDKEYTKEVDRAYIISFLGKKLRLSLPSREKTKNFERALYELDTHIYEDKRLPFSAVCEEKRYFTRIKKNRNETEALEIAKGAAENRLSVDSPAFMTAYVSEKTEANEKYFIYTCRFEGVENIALQKEFELS